jgi:predicted nucleic acid-binding protein
LTALKLKGARLMRPLSCLDDASELLIADTSSVINLNASGSAPEILHALPYKIAIADVIQKELDFGRERGRRDAELTSSLAAANHLEVVSLGDGGWPHFERLVTGAAAETLDDGEAATIAYAIEHSGVAIIDEDKATKICALRYPSLLVASSLDLFGHPMVCEALGPERLAKAVFLALREARMRVLPRHQKWVVDLIGFERAALCPSLPRKLREPD